ELKVDRTKNARVALMISLSWATLPRSRCKIRSARRGAPARRHLSGRAPAHGLLPRRTVGDTAAAGDEAIDFVAAAAAGAPARPIGAKAPEAEKVAIGPHRQFLGGEVAIAIFLRCGLRLAAFVHGGFLSSSSAPAPA